MRGRLRVLQASVALVVVALTWTPTPTAQQAVEPPASADRDNETGRPVIRNFIPQEYGGGAQNWALVQDSRGVLYVGSSNGILRRR